MSRTALPLTAIPLAALLAIALLAGCGPATPAPQSTSGAVTVDNCGFELTVDSPPERIITIKSTSTELVIALGRGDRIIGQAFPDGPLPETLSGFDIPTISEFAPSEESVLALGPDFVIGGWESNFTADTAGERDELAGLGIGTYVSPAACKDPGYKPEKLSFENLFDHIVEAGRLLDAADEAAELVRQQRDLLDSIEPSTAGLTALWWSSGTDTPYVGAGIGAPQLVLETAGLRNIAGDIDDTWSSLNWEAIIASDPDVIVLVDASWNTAESKRAYLASNPATAALPAVVNQRYIEVSFAASEAGVRTVEAAATVAEQLAALG